MSGRVVVIGSSNTDLIFQLERLPQPGETILGANLSVAYGGKGANQAVAAARTGARVSFVGRIGKDAYGDAALAALKKAKVDVSGVVRDRMNPSGIAVVILDRKGQNSIIVAPGSNAHLKFRHIDGLSLNPGDVLLLQLEAPVDAILRAVERGSDVGATVVLNPAPATRLPGHMLEMVDWIIPNETEAALLTGLNVSRLSHVRAAARELSAMGPRNVIITLGARGAYLYSGGNGLLIPAHKVKVVDTTGAGDAFVGVFAARLSRGDSPKRAVQWAQAAAALAVMKLGAQPSLPGWQKAARLMRVKKIPDLETF
jgi:ribokinase